ncbi:LacI family DNA-binding transcriptional regulator [Gelidibacter gilvus]|uniref:LacI family transcriptional regulator n=1 Tax=Gelidibacter gilvus TaxID=59602 RepID=A0A4V1LMR7_9FLAO|nr:LacI family DNA-binding transcriptional regulator [Gelidibacter gilvus]RXJ49436.1 LacI family transcriptional regulator [Gelidibacter gilvus]
MAWINYKKRNMMEVTMKTLSQMSGYSVSTVSKALRDKKDISIKTRQIIKELAESYDFVPNNSAIALRSQKSNTIAVIVPQIDSMIYGSMLNTIQMEAYKQGYRVVVQQYLNFENGEIECLKSLRNGGIDGVIVIGTSTALEELQQNSKDQFFPTIIKRVEDLTLKAQDYKHFGNKMITSLFSKINVNDSMRVNVV